MSGYGNNVSIPSVRPIDGEGRRLFIDAATNGLVIIDASHHEVHEGELFCAVRNGTLGLNGQRALLFITPSDYTAHMLINVRSAGESNYSLYEGTSYSAPGSDTPLPVCHNRQLKNVSKMTMQDSFTAQNTGSLIYAQHLGSGKSIGGEARSTEWVLAAGEVYMLVLTSEVADNDTFTELTWYEEEV